MKTKQILKTVGLLSALSLSSVTLFSCDSNSSGNPSGTLSGTEEIYVCSGGSTFFGDLPSDTIFMVISSDETTYKITIDGDSNNYVTVGGDSLTGSITSIIPNSNHDFATYEGLTQNGNFITFDFSEIIVHDNPQGNNPISARECEFVTFHP